METYTYCKVIPSGRKQGFYYISDIDVKVGDIVVIPYGSAIKVGRIKEIGFYKEGNAPFPPAQTKKIIRIYGDNENLNLEKEYSVLKKDIKEDKEKETLYDDISKGIILSKDGLTVENYDDRQNREKSKIIIPTGVKYISEVAFIGRKVQKLFINKELEELPESIYCNSSYIEVDKDNPKFYTDDIALYEYLPNNKVKLLYIFNKKITEYIAPNNLEYFSSVAFISCKDLKNIIINEGAKNFYHYSLCEKNEVKSILLPNSIEELNMSHTKYNNYFYTGGDIEYWVNEENERFFNDGDCLYEVLEDGTYKLVKCNYYGKGSTKVISNTSIIGENAFARRMDLESVYFPKSLKTISYQAFRDTGLREIILPENIEVVESFAFVDTNLKKIHIPETILDFAEDAIYETYNVKLSKETNKKVFKILEDGTVKRIDGKAKINIPRIIKNLANELSEYIIEINKQSKRKDPNARVLAFNYDKNNNTIKMEVNIESNISSILKLKVNDKLETTYNDECIEVLTPNNELLGSIESAISLCIYEVISFIDIKNVKIADIVKPKNIIVSFDLEAKKITESLSLEEQEIMSNFKYQISNNEVTILGIKDNSDKDVLEFPTKIEGYPVVALKGDVLEKYGPYGNPLKEIIIPEGIKRLEDDSLSSLPRTQIRIPKSIEYISPYVFGKKYKDLYLNSQTIFVVEENSCAEEFLRNYKPSREYGIKKISILINKNNNTVEDQQTLKKQQEEIDKVFDITISGAEIHACIKQSLRKKREIIEVPGTYMGNPVNLFNLRLIPDYVKKLIIPKETTNLYGVIPSEVNYFSYNECRCPSVEEIIISEDNQTYWSDGHAIYTKDKKKLLCFISASLEEYTVNETTEEMIEHAFTYKSNLKKLIIPSSVKKIEKDCFSYCESLEEIVGLDEVKEKSIDIFGGYYSMEKIPYITKKETFIFNNKLYHYKGTSQKVYQVPEGVKEIVAGAFTINDKKDSLEEIILPNSLEVINEKAFFKRSQLKKINIPNNVKVIEKEAFAECSSLEELYIPASVESIHSKAFPLYEPGMRYLPEIKCTFRNITVSEDNQHYESKDGILYSKSTQEIIHIPYLLLNGDLNIFEGKTKIIAGIYKKNNTIQTIIIPEGIKVIEKNAFEHCEKVTELIMPDSVEVIEDYAFFGCSKLSKIKFSKNLKTIGIQAFSGIGVKNLDLPESIEKIDTLAFAFNDKLEKACLPKYVKEMGYGIFSKVKEIEVYDSIDPTAKEPNDNIDTCNGNPNSMVGFIGIGMAHAMWQCAANHEWNNYTITVKSSETDKILYKVWMGADTTQRDYYCMLSSGWGNNATFAFKRLDEFFPKIRGEANKIQVAKYRLEYPVELSEENRIKYESYLSKKEKK